MRIPRTFFLYVTREVALYAALGFVAISTVMVSQNMLRRLDGQLAIGFTAPDLLEAFLCVFPMLTAYSLPVAFLFGTLLAMGRMSGDSEIMAVRACGLGTRALVAPVLVMAALVSALTLHLMLDVEYAAHRRLSHLFKSVAARGGILEAGVFRGMGDRVIFVRHRDRENQLEGVMISDRANPERPYLVFAEHGSFAFDEEAEIIRLRLESGDIHIVPESEEPEEYQRMAFSSFEYALDVSRITRREAGSIPPRQMSMAELREVLDRVEAGGSIANLREPNPVEYEIQIHHRLAVPFAPIVFALLAVGMGVRNARTERAWGALACLIITFAYYALMAFAEFGVRDLGDLSAGRDLGAQPVVRGGRHRSAGVQRPGNAQVSESLVRIRAGSVLLVTDPAYEASLRAQGVLDPSWLDHTLQEAASGSETGRTRSAVVEVPDLEERLHLRGQRHGGVLAPLWGTRVLGLGRTVEELRTGQRLRARGAPISHGVAAIGVRSGLLWRAGLLTVYEEGSCDGITFLRNMPTQSPKARLDEAIRSAATAIRRFHDVGGSHPDLHLGNLLVRERGDRTDVVVIDLDRAGSMTPPSPRRRLTELMRLLRSLHKRGLAERLDADATRRFFSTYVSGDTDLGAGMLAGWRTERARIAIHGLGYNLRRRRASGST